MVTHIVMWNFLETMSDAEKQEAGKKMKETLEALKDVIPGILSLKVTINQLPGSNREIMLYGEYESIDALNHYVTHPGHVEAGKYIRSVTCDRACMDF